LLTTVGYKFGDEVCYALEGSIAIAGAAITWLINNLGAIDDPKQITEKALQVEDNGGVYFVPAFSGLFAPYWRSDAKGAILGMTMNTNICHICRAILEATSLQTLDIIKSMEKDSNVKISKLRVDGGMTKSELLLQLQSDILLISVEKPKDSETTARGAAIAAGMGIGLWDKDSVIKLMDSETKKYTPKMEESKRNKIISGWEKSNKISIIPCQ